MAPDRFRQNIASTVLVPGAGVSTKATAADAAVRQLLGALHNGDSIAMTSEGMSAEPNRTSKQWLTVQSAGSTGVPKTIRRRPESWIASFEVTQSRFGVSSLAPYAVLGSLSHSLTLYAVLEALHLGCDLAVLTGMSPRAQVAEMRGRQTQVLYATPTQLRLLIDTDAAPVEAVRWVFCGGGKLDEATRDRAASFFPNAALREFFGASETSFITIGDASTPVTTVGCAYPGVELRVRDKHGCDITGAGEIWVKSPYLFDGYADGNSGDTRWDDGFLSIGEFGCVDQTGNLTVLGRKYRMVTIADHNVFPEMVEAHLQSNPNVEKCAVITVPDPLRGYGLIAFVEGSEDTSLADVLLRSCRSALGTHATPRRIEFVDTIPMLDAGKPDLIALVQMLENAR